VIDDGYWHEWVRATEAAGAVRAPRSGFLTRIDAERVGQAAMQLGVGRQRAEDTVDYHVGIEVVHPIGTAIEARTDLALIGYRNEKSLETALPLLESAFEIGDTPPPPTPLILETIP
jgi:pyrimidine-nucleoside phosphorylase